MKFSSPFVACVLCAPALSTPGEVPLAFGPEEGSSLSKSHAVTIDFALEDFSLVVDGEDIGAIMGGFDFSMMIDLGIEVTDEYIAMADGRPAKLQRTFERLANDVSISVISEFGGEDQEMPSESDLEGRTVVFSWNPDEEEYDVSFPGGEGDEALLEGLHEDMDFRALLPEKDVSEGESWNVPLSQLGTVSEPGGNLKLLPDTGGEELGDFGEMQSMFEEKFSNIDDLLEGQWTCTFAGMSEDDPSLALITIESNIEATIDFSEMILEVVNIFAEEADEEIPDISVDTADLTIEFEGNGALVWNTAEGHYASFELGGDIIFSADLAVSVDVEGESHSAEMYLEMAGSFENDVEASE